MKASWPSPSGWRALHGPEIESVIFSCSGTEANEVALRMARMATGKAGIVCTNATYHGNSEAVGKMTRIGAGQNTGRRRARDPLPRDAAPAGARRQRGRAAARPISTDCGR